jgi:hypothetical protein
MSSSLDDRLPPGTVLLISREFPFLQDGNALMNAKLPVLSVRTNRYGGNRDGSPANTV